ncbi:hypothetical protein [Pelagibius sp. Alg239-R121]|uniref:hypothetical protein n=1 Tax=Pelagibius sp. Alg239-R121 TaxID=2993448 RepID=UPI0024A6E05D|nr:hypothetical protein [Pelagibius sp. Alg239-R121]
MDYWTLGAMADANIILSAWCEDCRHKNHIDPNDLINRPALSPFVNVRELREKIVCSACGSRSINLLLQDRHVVETWYPDPETWAPDDDSHLRDEEPVKMRAAGS